MATAKLQLKIGNVEFACEGEEVWVATQLDKVLLQISLPRLIYSQSDWPRNIKIEIQHTNVVDQICDVLILKHAQEFYGADQAISRLLQEHGIELEKMKAKPGEFRLFSSAGIIAAHRVLFVGVEPISQFGYQEILNYSDRALRILSTEVPDAVHIAMTIHGVGYGLNEREAFGAQLSGWLTAIHQQAIPPRLKQITLVEHDQDRAIRLKQILDDYLATRGKL